jgi:hypothetical protein
MAIIYRNNNPFCSHNQGEHLPRILPAIKSRVSTSNHHRLQDFVPRLIREQQPPLSPLHLAGATSLHINHGFDIPFISYPTPASPSTLQTILPMPCAANNQARRRSHSLHSSLSVCTLTSIPHHWSEEEYGYNFRSTEFSIATIVTRKDDKYYKVLPDKILPRNKLPNRSLLAPRFRSQCFRPRRVWWSYTTY